MGILKLKYTQKDYEGYLEHFITQGQFHKFNSSVLELGDISKEGEYFEALAAFFDLEGFTSFCNQIDPHLVVPEYLSEFLNWLFTSISKETTMGKERNEIVLWCPLPFFAKFVGDGVLFLWDKRSLSPKDIGNIVLALGNICDEYRETFLSSIKNKFTKPPSVLRCGIARGQIISIGDGRDFVGSCINVAARLQKVGQFSFAFSKRGFNLTTHFEKSAADYFTLIKMPIRGIGEEELIYVRKSDFDALTDKERADLATL